MAQTVDKVEVISGWWSKVNWTQAVAAASMILVLVFGQQAALTPEQQTAIVVVIGLVGNAVTVVLKTWYGAVVTKSSLSAPQKLTLKGAP